MQNRSKGLKTFNKQQMTMKVPAFVLFCPQMMLLGRGLQVLFLL